jgi:hypothetical protein
VELQGLHPKLQPEAQKQRISSELQLIMKMIASNSEHILQVDALHHPFVLHKKLQS